MGRVDSFTLTLLRGCIENVMQHGATGVSEVNVAAALAAQRFMVSWFQV
jgi:hypothetical protein